MTAIYDRTAKALAALDCSAENSAIAERAAEGERLSAAMRKAEARIAEVTAQLSEILQDRLAERRAAVAVADALLGEADASQATATVARERDLREELTALRAGLRELEERARVCGEDIARLKGDALAKLAPILRPAVDEIMADARAAAEAVARSFAACAAITTATRHFDIESKLAGNALARLMASGLIARRNVIPTPDDAVEMLAPLTSKGAAVAGIVPTMVNVPEDTSAIAVMAGMAARQAVG